VTWEEFLGELPEVLDSGTSTAITIGTAPLDRSGWFDYLSLRTNGYDFHMALTAGEIPWTDDSVRAVFANWRKIDMGAFIDNHAAIDWQEAAALLVQGEAAPT
jgi:multiple sugar transport system substrate-binding protein